MTARPENAIGPANGADAMSEQSGSDEVVSTSLSPEYRREARGATARPVGVFEWMRAVRDAPLDDLPRRVKGTLFVLATYADADGRRAFPGLETLGEKVGKAADNIGRDVKLAVDRGYLTRSRPKPHATYRYRLTVPVDPTKTSGLNESDPTETSGHDPTETSAYLTNDHPSTEQTEGLLREDALEEWVL